MGPMLGPVRHQDHLARIDPNLAVAKIHAQPTGDDEEQLVFGLMVVPDEAALELHHFDLLAIQLRNDFGTEVFRKGRQLLRHADLVHVASIMSPATPSSKTKSGSKTPRQPLG